MDRPALDAPIRKITVGDVKEGFTFVTGQPYRIGRGDNAYRVLVTEVVRNENSFHLTGDITYIVYATIEGGDGSEFVWKTFERVPTSIEYIIPV